MTLSTKHTEWLTVIFQSCTYNLVKILPLVPTSTTVQYCVQLQAWQKTHINSTTFGIL